MFVLVVVAHRQHRVVGQVGFEDAVADFALQLIVIAE